MLVVLIYHYDQGTSGEGHGDSWWFAHPCLSWNLHLQTEGTSSTTKETCMCRLKWYIMSKCEIVQSWYSFQWPVAFGLDCVFCVTVQSGIIWAQYCLALHIFIIQVFKSHPCWHNGYQYVLFVSITFDKYELNNMSRIAFDSSCMN